MAQMLSKKALRSNRHLRRYFDADESGLSFNLTQNGIRKNHQSLIGRDAPQQFDMKLTPSFIGLIRILLVCD